MKRSTDGVWMVLALAVLALGLSIGEAHAAVCTWTGAWDTTPSNATDVIVVSSGGNLTWSTNSLPAVVASWTQNSTYTGTVTVQTVYGATGFTNFTVSGDVTLSGGTWAHAGNTGTEAKRLRVNVGGNLFITNATITADALGYSAQTGPGAGTASGRGGVYGGAAGGGSGSANLANTYGSVIAPTNLGSGGVSGSGGGAILLTVAGTTTVAAAGIISAGGGSGQNGGGSGGSVYLTTGWLAGNGTIRADGGTEWNSTGDGSGGRVAIVLTGTGADFTSWNGTNTAYGKITAYQSAAGTVYRKTAAGVDSLIIDNNNIALSYQITTTLSAGTKPLNSFSNVVINHKGVLCVDTNATLDFTTFASNLTVYGSANSYLSISSDTNVTFPADWSFGGYTLFGQGITKTLTNVMIGTNGALSHCMNGTAYGGAETYKLKLTITGNLTVLSNGTITADAVGFKSGGTGGGVHGGLAYNNASMLPYGSVIAPTNLGSGGSGGYGGGAILLNVAGTTTVAAAGTITANGGFSTASGGGAGGSVYLTTGWLAGSGTIQANGGGNGNNAGDGSGGRVAVILTGSGADFSAAWTGKTTAYGAADCSGYQYGTAGTVYLKTQAGADTLIIDNNSTPYYQYATVLPVGAPGFNSFSNVIISHKGTLGVKGFTSIDFNTFTNNLTIYGPANSYVSIYSDTNTIYPANWTIAGYTLFAQGITQTLMNVMIGTNGAISHSQNSGAETYKVNLSLAGNLAILSNGTITADAVGYGSGSGTGAGGSGGYGGVYGGLAYNNNKNAYGFITAPTNMGSGGSGGNGGGAILLTVAGTTTVAAAGTITANGQNGGSNGGGAGGSVNLTTGWLTGSGTIQTTGGGNGNAVGDGSGGRVAIVLTGAGADFSTWTGINTAYGSATFKQAAAGTVYRAAAGISAGSGTVIVNNGNTATNATYTPLPAFSNSTENISKTIWMTTNKARIGLVANTNIASLTLNVNGYLELGGYTLTVKALTVTNKVYKSGTYGPHETPISPLTDSGAAGKVIVNAGLGGTTLLFR